MDDSERLRSVRTTLIAINMLCIVMPCWLAWYTYHSMKPASGRLAWTDPITIGAAILAGMFIVYGMSYFSKTIVPATQTTSLKKKLSFYRRGYVTRSIILACVALFPILLVEFENCYGYFIFSLVPLLMLAVTWPTLGRIKATLRIR